MSYRIICVLLIFALTSCGWKISPPPRSEHLSELTQIAERVVMTIDDRDVIWGDGQLGDIVRDTLISAGAFKEVYYPVEPRKPPNLKLLIKASGKVDEEIGLGIVKSIIIGALLFIPVGLIRFSKTFDLDAEVIFLHENQELRKFQVASQTGVSHTMFSQIKGYESAVRQAAFMDLGERIATELSMFRID